MGVVNCAGSRQLRRATPPRRRPRGATAYSCETEVADVRSEHGNPGTKLVPARARRRRSPTHRDGRRRRRLLREPGNGGRPCGESLVQQARRHCRILTATHFAFGDQLEIVPTNWRPNPRNCGRSGRQVGTTARSAQSAVCRPRHNGTSLSSFDLVAVPAPGLCRRPRRGQGRGPSGGCASLDPGCGRRPLAAAGNSS